MAWDDEMVTVVRNLVQDVGDAPVYSDARLAELILVTAMGMDEAEFAHAYSVSVENGTLSPDPTAKATRDVGFVNLVCLKAAHRLILAEIRTLIRQGIVIHDDGSKIDLKRDPRALKLMADSYARQYADALYSYKVGDGDLGEVIVAPYPIYSDDGYGVDDRSGRGGY